MTSGRVHARPRGLTEILRRGNLGALVLPLLLLAVGAGARARLSRKTVTYHWRGVQLAHPAGWTVAERSADPAEGNTIVLVDLLGPGRIKPRVTLRIAPLSPAPGEADEADADLPQAGQQPGRVGGAPGAPGAAPEGRSDGQPLALAAAALPPPPLAPALTATLSNRLPLYYVISDQRIEIGKVAASRVDSAFAFTPPPLPGRRSGPGRKGDIPVVMRAIDVVMLRGTDALSVQVAAPIDEFETQRPVLEAIIGSIRIDPAIAPANDGPLPPQGVAAGTGDQAPVPSAAPAGTGETGASNGAEGGSTVTVAGQVIDAESGLAVPGAIVVFLAPGTTVDGVNDDNLTQVAYTTGLADSTGHFATNRGLARAGRYGVLVVADGYRWIGTDDAVAVAGGTASPLNIGVVPLRRR